MVDIVDVLKELLSGLGGDAAVTPKKCDSKCDSNSLEDDSCYKKNGGASDVQILINENFLCRKVAQN